MLIKSGVITSMSGSIGGLVGSHNRGGMYFRARSIPVNPGSAFQQGVRASMSQLTVAWQETLTAGQRSDWETYAANVPTVGPLGDQRFLTGQNHYIRSNIPRLQVGLPRVDDAPTVFDLGSFTDPTFGFDATDDEIDVTFDNTDSWANEDDAAMLVYASEGKALSINYFQGPYRHAGDIDGDSVTPPTSPSAIAMPFSVTAGLRYFARVRVSRADGRLSSSFRGFATGA